MLYLKLYIAMFFICWFVFYGINFAYWTIGRKGGYWGEMSDALIGS